MPFGFYSDVRSLYIPGWDLAGARQSWGAGGRSLASLLWVVILQLDQSVYSVCYWYVYTVYAHVTILWFRTDRKRCTVVQGYILSISTSQLRHNTSSVSTWDPCDLKKNVTSFQGWVSRVPPAPELPRSEAVLVAKPRRRSAQCKKQNISGKHQWNFNQ